MLILCIIMNEGIIWISFSYHNTLLGGSANDKMPAIKVMPYN